MYLGSYIAVDIKATHSVIQRSKKKKSSLNLEFVQSDMAWYKLQFSVISAVGNNFKN